MEISIERAIMVAVVIVSVFSLGFMAGKAYYRRKYKMTKKEIKRLQKQNKLMKKLSPKLKWGEDKEKADYLPENFLRQVIPHKETKPSVKIEDGVLKGDLAYMINQFKDAHPEIDLGWFNDLISNIIMSKLLFKENEPESSDYKALLEVWRTLRDEIVPPLKEDDDTKTGELKLENPLEGHPALKNWNL